MKRPPKREPPASVGTIMLNVSFDAILVWRQSDRVITYWNKGAEELYGYSAGEALGQISHNLLRTSDQPDAVKRFRSDLEQSGSWMGVLEHYTRDGRKVYVESRRHLVEKARGRRLVLETNRDVTKRMRAEEQLRDSEARHRRIFESNMLGIFFWDVEGTVTEANRAFLDMMGYTTEEVSGGQVNWRQMTAGGYRDVGENALVSISEIGQSATYEKEFIRKDGSRLPVILAGAMLEGHKDGGVTLAVDITRRKRTEERLREYEKVLEGLEEMIAVIDRDYRYVIANRAFLKQRGLEREEEIIGRLVSEVIDREVFEEVAKKHLDECLRGRPVKYELRYRYPDLGERDLAISYLPVEGRDGVDRVACVLSDVTDRKRAEEALTLKEEQLRQAKKMEAVGRLAGGVAHDFNNLLTAIIGYSELALMQLKQEDRLRSNIEEIKKAGRRAADLTRQLLAFSRRQVMQPRPLNLNRVIGDINGMLGRLIGEDVEVRTVLERNLCAIRADPSQIDQVIVNLVVNARDAMPLGGKLTIETANVFLDESYAAEHLGVTPGLYARLSITDSGLGMDRATQESIFEPFFTTKEATKGTGLGLATVYGIVKQSGGWIWVYSELGKGTTFKIYLPHSKDPVEERRPAPSKGGPLMGSETVLLVDDEEAVANIAYEALVTYGYTVLKVTDGFQALAVSKHYNGPIHLLLTDVVMPRMSGREVAEQITAVRPEVLVLFMSGYTETAIVHHSVLDEGIDLVEKPFSPESLSRRVREVLDRRGARAGRDPR
jgi:two-component system cell cycle sensor histidine kinase/response regulator CckA